MAISQPTAITRTPVFIDKLSLTLHVPTDEQDTVTENFHQTHLEGVEIERIQFGEALKTYQYAWRLNLDNGEFCLIQHSPRRGRSNFLRIEFNPAKVGRIGCDAVFQLLARSIPSFASALQNARVTRIDIAFDVDHPISRLLVFDTPRKQVSRTFTTQGELNALTIGSLESDRYLLVYDKRLEDEVCSGRITARIKTRFELRLRDLSSFADLGRINNPLMNYTVRELDFALAQQSTHEWKWLLHASSVIGAQAALSLIQNRTVRRRIRDALRTIPTPSWWNPESIWSEVPAALRYVLIGDLQRRQRRSLRRIR